MEQINNNNLNPAAPGGTTNVIWQAEPNPSVLVVTAVTNNAGACQITLSGAHNLITGDAGFLNSESFPAIAGQWVVTKIDATNLVLNGSVFASGYVADAATFQPARDVSAYMPLMLGDGTGSPPLSGGVSGAVPAPPSGAAAAGEYLNAAGGWSSPAGGVNAQTASYAAVQGDTGKLISFSSASALTLTLPVSPALLYANWWIAVECVGAGGVTISPNTHNIDGAASNLSLAQNQGIVIYTDGANYFTMRGPTLLLKTNGVANSVQSKLDIAGGSNVTVANVAGVTTIAATGGGAGFADPFHSVVTPPGTGSWTWATDTASPPISVQGGATFGTNLDLNAPIDATAGKRRMVYVALSSSPYTVIAAITGFTLDTSATWAIFVGTSPSGKFVSVSMASNAIKVNYLTSYNSTSSIPVNSGIDFPVGVTWFRIQDDGTNLIFSISQEGAQWVLLGTLARAAFLSGTATVAGFYTLAGASFPATCTLLSWSITYP